MANTYITKLVSKIKAKQAQLDTLTSMVHHYSPQTGTAFANILLENSIDPSMLSSHRKASTETSEDKEKCIIIPGHDELFDNLYKQLTLKAHPDKSKDEGKEFIDIKEAYDNKNILALIDYGCKYNIVGSETIIDGMNSNLITLILERQLFTLKNKIKDIRSTTSYTLLVDKDGLSKTTQLARELNDTCIELEKVRKQNAELRERKLARENGD